MSSGWENCAFALVGAAKAKLSQLFPWMSMPLNTLSAPEILELVAASGRRASTWLSTLRAPGPDPGSEQDPNEDKEEEEKNEGAPAPNTLEVSCFVSPGIRGAPPATINTEVVAAVTHVMQTLLGKRFSAMHVQDNLNTLLPRTGQTHAFRNVDGLGTDAVVVCSEVNDEDGTDGVVVKLTLVSESKSCVELRDTMKTWARICSEDTRNATPHLYTYDSDRPNKVDFPMYPAPRVYFKDFETLARIARRAIDGRQKMGFLLHGPSGTGKTLFTRWLAREAAASGWDVHDAKDSDIVSTLARIRSKGKPALLVMNEADQYPALCGFVERRGEDACDEQEEALRKEAWERKQRQILDIMDPLIPTAVLYVATTNNPEKLIPEVKRPGRLGDQIVDTSDQMSQRVAAEMWMAETGHPPPPGYWRSGITGAVVERDIRAAAAEASAAGDTRTRKRRAGGTRPVPAAKLPRGAM